MDTSAVTLVHVLVIPQEHCAYLEDVTSDMGPEIFLVAIGSPGHSAHAGCTTKESTGSLRTVRLRPRGVPLVLTRGPAFRR